MSAKIMYDYVEGYCPVLHYRCLMPVEYQKQADEQFHKVQCACENSPNCSNKKSCENYNNAPEVQVKWKLREKKLI